MKLITLLLAMMMVFAVTKYDLVFSDGRAYHRDCWFEVDGLLDSWEINNLLNMNVIELRE